MGWGFDEVLYSDRRRTQHRVTILLMIAAAWIACLLGTALTDWPLRNAIAMMGIALLFGAGLWWMFGSRKAGRLVVSSQARDWFKRIGINRR